jgi:rubredoxin
MAPTYIIDEDGPREILCPRCRVNANWRFLDDAKSLIEVICPDCGLFEVPRIEFEKAEADVAELDERT